MAFSKPYSQHLPTLPSLAFDVDADTEGTNYTAQWVENVLKEHKSKQLDTKKEKKQKGIQTYLENKCAVQIQDEKMTVKKSLDNKNAIGTFELALEEKFPPNAGRGSKTEISPKFSKLSHF